MEIKKCLIQCIQSCLHSKRCFYARDNGCPEVNFKPKLNISQEGPLVSIQCLSYEERKEKQGWQN